MQLNKTTILIFMLLASLEHIESQTDFLGKLSSSLHLYYEKYPRESVTFYPAMNVVSPGMRLPFAVVLERDPLHTPGRLSRSLILKLFDEKGRVIAQTQVKTESDRYSGEFPVPEELTPGRYYLYVYSSWMKNESPALLKPFPVYVSNDIDPAMDLQLFAEQPVLQAGDTLKIQVRLTSKGIDKPGGTAFNIEFAGTKKTFWKGKYYTDENGYAEINIPVAAETTGRCKLRAVVTTKGKRLVSELPVQVVAGTIQAVFYPESGNLIAGVENMVRVSLEQQGFLITKVKGEITDDQQKSYGLVQSVGHGMAVFSITPRERRKYFLRYLDPSGQKIEFPLPEAVPGIALHLMENTPDTARFALQKSPGMQSGKLLIVLESAGIIYRYSIVDADQIIAVSLENIPFGPARLAVFDENGTFLTERWFLVKNGMLNVLGEGSYSSSDRNLNLHLSIKDPSGNPVTGNAIISCTIPAAWTDDAFAVDGYGEGSLNPDAMSPVLPDNVGLFDLQVCGFQSARYSWSRILGEDRGQLPYENRDFIEGYLLDRKSLAIAQQKVVLKSSSGNTAETVTDDKGYFRFSNFAPSAEEIFSVYPPELAGKKKYTIRWNDPFEDALIELAKTRASLYQFTSCRFYSTGKKMASRQNQVVLPANISSDFPKYPPGLSLLEIIKQKKNYQIINNQIVFIGYINSYYAQQGALIVIDGVSMGTDISILQQIPPEDIENINVSTDVNDIHKYTALNSIGVIEIRTRKGKYVEKELVKFNGPDFFWYWEPFTAVQQGVLEKSVAVPPTNEKYTIRIWMFDQEGRKGAVTWQ